MKLFLGILCAIALFFSWLPTEQEKCAQKLAKLESIKSEWHANSFRSRSECQAQLIEFRDQSLYRDCMTTAQNMSQITSKDIDAVNARYKDADIIACLKSQ